MEVPTYDLPEEAIAQRPLPERDAARLLDALDPAGTVVHRRVRELPALVGPGDVVVVNSSKVIPARLLLRKQTGGAAEVLLVESQSDAREWVALVRPGRRLPPGTLLFAGERPVVEVGDRLGDGRRKVRLLLEADEKVGALIGVLGRVPLPPYIHEPLADPGRYQTIYAERPGSVAAPTAGLHLTATTLDGIRAAGARVVDLDLAVGLGTFKPVSAAQVEDHVMHRERYRIPAPTWEACRQARRVVAIGTTTVRALESAAASGQLEGHSSLFIHGAYPFAVVDVLLTNFHQPHSTLLTLLESFCGPRWRDLYRDALEHGYRFLSFGDAMIVGRA